MRISDWSSDVCSSDLTDAQRHLGIDARVPLRMHAHGLASASSTASRIALIPQNSRIAASGQQMAVAVARPRPMLLPPLVVPPKTSSDKPATRIGPTAAPTRPTLALKNAMPVPRKLPGVTRFNRSEEHTPELQSLM